MKTSLLAFTFILFSHFSFSQLVIGGLEGLRDTSNFPELRGKIETQSLFIRLDSTSPGPYFKRAILEYQLGNYQTCIDEMNRILKRFPANAGDAYCNRGMAYVFLGNYKQAIEDLRKAKESDPDDPKNYLNLAFAKAAAGHFESAIPELDTAIAIRPSYAKAYANRALAKARLKRFAEAVEDYNNALVYQPGYPEVYHGRGYALLMLDRPQEALADYTTALKLIPPLINFHDFLVDRSMIYEKLGNKTKAKEDMDAALLIKP